MAPSVPSTVEIAPASAASTTVLTIMFLSLSTVKSRTYKSKLNPCHCPMMCASVKLKMMSTRMGAYTKSSTRARKAYDTIFFVFTARSPFRCFRV